MQLCPSCGRETPEGFPRCANCGAELTVEAGRQERKLVTVVFCDLVGFTSRAEQMDPEDVRALLEPYHVHVRSELERFGGTVEKFIGDAVMAVFGAPVAHEDDPERAVRGALASRDWAAENGIELRIGVNTGEALVTIGGEPLATGDVVNTAARLQAAAPPGGVLVGETTYRATRDRIDYAERAPVEAKGKADPVPVWLAEQARSRVTVERLHGATLVGRERERRLLVDALERTQAERQPQLVTLVGVPGIGKSRLVYELFQEIETARFGLVYWRHGRCLPYGEGVSLWALGEIVKAQAGILETDPPEEVERKLDEAAGDPWVAKHLRPLVGLEAEAGGSEGRVEAFAAWRRFLEELTGERPLVVVVEDLHWADDDLLDFVDHLVDRAADVALLVLCTARPELLERRPAWGGGKPNAVTITLSPLSDEDTSRLISELLERAVLPAETHADLLLRAGGNPLYAEQFARMLAESGDAEAVPETVQGIVAARLDLLEPDQKALLLDAAVLGKTFWAGGVAAMAELDRFAVEELLHPLERKDFVRRERRSTVAEDSQYAFLHVLVRDVAYGQIPRGERAERHRRAAEWIESLGRPEDHAELLAHHYLSALDLAAAAGQALPDLEPRAARALGEAGDRALALSAFGAAQRFYEAALRFTPEDDGARAGLLLRASRALRRLTAGDEVVAEAADALRRAGDVEGAAEAELILAELAWFRADRDSADVHLARAASLLESAPPSEAKARVLAETARYAALGGDEARALKFGREAMAMAERLGLESLRAHAGLYVGTAELTLGDDRGLETMEESVRIWQRLNSPDVARGYNNLGVSRAALGDLRGAADTWRAGLAAVAQFGEFTMVDWLRHQLNVPVAYFSGDWDAVVAHVERKASDADYLRMNRHDARSRIRLARGDVTGALADAEVAMQVGRTVRDPQLFIPSVSCGLTVSIAAGRRDDANRLADELLVHPSLSHNRSHHSGPWVDLSWGLLDLGRGEDLAAAIGRVEARTLHVDAAEAIARGDYVAAAAIYARMGHLPAEAYARLRAAQAGLPDADLDKAIAFFRKVRATAYLAQAEQLAAASA